MPSGTSAGSWSTRFGAGRSRRPRGGPTIVRESGKAASCRGGVCYNTTGIRYATLRRWELATYNNAGDANRLGRLGARVFFCRPGRPPKKSRRRDAYQPVEKARPP
jgi:hypothetical protein